MNRVEALEALYRDLYGGIDSSQDSFRRANPSCLCQSGCANCCYQIAIVPYAEATYLLHGLGRSRDEVLERCAAQLAPMFEEPKPDPFDWIKLRAALPAAEKRTLPGLLAAAERVPSAAGHAGSDCVTPGGLMKSPDPSRIYQLAYYEIVPLLSEIGMPIAVAPLQVSLLLAASMTTPEISRMRFSEKFSLEGSFRFWEHLKTEWPETVETLPMGS
jgi:hypothetical protein